MKQLTYDQVAGRKEKAARFVRNVLDDPDRAAEIEDEAVEDYADRRRIEIRENPTMLRKKERSSVTKQELEARNRELEEENETLREQLDQIADIAAPLDDDEDVEDDDEEDLVEEEVEDDED